MPKHPKTIEEDLRSIKESELLNQPKPSPFAKYATKLFFTFGGLLTLVLLISFIFLSYPIDHIIAGKLESHSPITNTLIINNLKIIFEQDTQQQLQSIYNEEQQVEFSVCLLGERIVNSYHITSLYTPKMYQQTFNHVVFEPCSSDTLIMLHSHPYKSCLASDTDLNTLQQTQQSNPNILMIVMCEPNRFSVYG
jgi:proteasome lid subunit RPN8/RPN11